MLKTITIGLLAGHVAATVGLPVFSADGLTLQLWDCLTLVLAIYLAAVLPIYIGWRDRFASAYLSPARNLRTIPADDRLCTSGPACGMAKETSEYHRTSGAEERRGGGGRAPR